MTVVCSDMQRSQSVPALDVGVGASFQQESRGPQVPVLGRHVQRRETFL